MSGQFWIEMVRLAGMWFCYVFIIPGVRPQMQRALVPVQRRSVQDGRTVKQ